MPIRVRLIVAMALAGLMAVPALANAEQKIVIGTGGPSGVYYQAGGAICRLVNLSRKRHDIDCAITTGGSVDNIKGIRRGDLDMGIAQSDWQFHAYEGTRPEKFPGGAFKALRTVFALHPEPFTVLARADAGINSFEDLQGKRVNVGNPGSGQRGTMEIVMERMGWTLSDFRPALELTSSVQAAALCGDRVDAIVFTVGHPNGSIKEATTNCDTNLVPVDNDVVRKLVADNPYYTMVTIPGGMYKGNPNDTRTFGVGATFVTSTRTDAETVYQVVKSVFDNLDRFKRMHPAFGALEASKMIRDNLSAPLHEGAARYYKERGWL